MTRAEANKLVFGPHGYNITTSGGIYLLAGRKIGICYFDWSTRELQQINVPASLVNLQIVKEVRALCLLHDITVKTMESQ